MSPKKGGTAKSKAFSSFLQGRKGLFVSPFLEGEKSHGEKQSRRKNRKQFFNK
jgi:hypothetical protein